MLTDSLYSSFVSVAKKVPRKYRNNFWWNPELDKLHTLPIRSSRTKDRAPSENNIFFSQAVRKRFKRRVKSAKAKWFEKSCNSSDNQWEMYRKVSTKKGPNLVVFNNELSEPILEPDANAT
mmetsp:Transcript_22498/g.29199  ORF Transcript_22498/g.29199 Transcript_22498/m.29199 type:complete len:121 (-) Transcript_22498:23-385(-)